MHMVRVHLGDLSDIFTDNLQVALINSDVIDKDIYIRLFC